MNLDQVILVDENDAEIGVMDKIEAHRGKGKLHRASSVFLFNKNGELLLQQRSSKKIVGALQWANTCCGNVRPGESYEECAVRRLREELGITNVVLDPVHKFIYQVQCNKAFSEYEMDTVFVGKYDGEVKPNPEEVANFKWIAWEEFIGMLNDKNPMLVPWNQIMNEKGILKYVKS
ncbi:MAG TPA: isopentenyl-diphosphate Delta-isomerase [Patescibacteria group bacterium]|nr:isopentenyl-diphosphate Delta-isomerase [Patescibacteria group bacterium]